MKQTKHPKRSLWWFLVAGLALSTSAPAAKMPAVNDTEIADALDLQLLLDDKISFNDLDVKVANGVATLEGKSRHLLAKERAARIAESVKGVRAVVNLIKVRPQTGVSGDQLAGDVNTALFSDPATDSYEVEASADGYGKVTLSGEVDSWLEKNLAEKVAKSVRGVTAVENGLSVKSVGDRSDSEIGKDVEARLAWNILVDDDLITVDVDAGGVTLRGTVGSAAEKRRARYNAWGIRGVKAVDDSKLKVERWARDEDLRKTKDLRKSNEEIRDALADALVWDPRVISFEIEPEVSNGQVTLRGTVDNLKAKQAAERVARHTVGVTSVDNFIRIRFDDPPPDSEIHANLIDRFKLDPVVEGHEISITVAHGVVSLRGEVDTVAERLQAGDVASGMKGVIHVSNFITVAGGDDARDYDPYIWDYTWPYHAASLSRRLSPNDRDAESESASENALEGGAEKVHNKLEVNH